MPPEQRSLPRWHALQAERIRRLALSSSLGAIVCFWAIWKRKRLPSNNGDVLDNSLLGRGYPGLMAQMKDPGQVEAAKKDRVASPSLIKCRRVRTWPTLVTSKGRIVDEASHTWRKQLAPKRGQGHGQGTISSYQATLTCFRRVLALILMREDCKRPHQRAEHFTG